MERDLNRATVYDQASAKATETRGGTPTVTVQATFTDGEAFSQTNTLHLSLEAAHALLRDLREVLVL